MRWLIAAALLASLVPAVQGADDENPFRNCKVGDWVEHKMTGPNMEGTSKMTIVSKGDKEVTYEITSTYTAQGTKMVGPVQTIKVDLTQPYDAISAANLKANNVKIEKLGEGKEKLQAAGKEYDTKWTALKATTTVNDMTIVTDFKMWFCKDVPVSGLVRMDTTATGMVFKLELVGSGSK